MIPLNITRFNTYHNENKEIKRVLISSAHNYFARQRTTSTGYDCRPTISLKTCIDLPAGLRPPVFAGVARPPRPKAASPAKGLLPSLPICNNDEEIHRSKIGEGGGSASNNHSGCA